MLAVSGRSSVACFLALWGLALPLGARANDFDQFQNARVAYESLNYDLASDLFEGLLADAVPGDKRPLISESRKYLAATYLFLGRPADADAQFTLLLQAEPEYVLDPLAFPAEVVQVFAAVKARIGRERAQAAEDKSRAEEKNRVDRAMTDEQQRERMQRLLHLASTERVVEVRSRWIAAIPFGAGQFQNDHDGLGLVLAVSQGVLLATSVVAFVVHESLRGQDPAAHELESARLAEVASRYTNQISLGLFAVVAITGVIDAQLRFQPSHSTERQRGLPADLLTIGPGSVKLKF